MFRVEGQGDLVKGVNSGDNCSYCMAFRGFLIYVLSALRTKCHDPPSTS